MQGYPMHDPALLPAPHDASERGVDVALAAAYAASEVEVRTATAAWTVRPLADVDPTAAVASTAFPAGVRSLSVVTACNPRSRRLSQQENAARDLALRGRLDALGLRWWPALNRPGDDPPRAGDPGADDAPDPRDGAHDTAPDDGDRDAWDEPSVAVHDLSIEDGVALARELDQAAYHVWTPGRLTLVWVPPTGRVSADQRAATTLRRPT